MANRNKKSNPNTDLPEGWVRRRLEEVAQINPRHPPDIVPEDAEVSFVPMPAIDEKSWKFKEIQTRSFGEVRKGYTHFAEGDVLFAKITPCMENGKAAIARDLVNGIGCGTTELHVIRPKMGIASEFIYYYVHQKSFREKAAAHMTGTAGQLRVPLNFMKEAPIPFPPHTEQRLIVARVEALLERVRMAKENLDKVPQIIKRFRQAVLKKAFSGELTAEWREKRPDLEPATELLKRIQEERKKRYEEEVKKAKAEGKRPPKKPKYLENVGATLAQNRAGASPAPTEQDLPELPDGWVWCRLGEIVDVNKETRNPTKEVPDEEFIYVDITGVEGGTGRIKEIKKIRGENAPSRARRVIHADDVIMSTVRPYLKAFAIIPPEYSNHICSTGFAVLTCNKAILPEFLLNTLFSDIAIDQCNRMMVGTHYPALNEAHVYQIQIPLPSPPEQREIVRQVEVLFKFAAEVEKRVEKAKERVEKITQSVLSKAFRGELTENFREAVRNWKKLDLEERRKYIFTLPEEEQRNTLHSDEFPLEPASVLLQRIQGKNIKQGRKERKREPRQLTLWN